MIFTEEQVFDACDRIAPQFNLDVKLIKALCLQESGKNVNGTFAPDRARLEQGFYSHYIEKENLETTNEVLYSASYGITQMLGESLKEIGYFDWWFSNQSSDMKIFLGNAYSEISIPKAINAYCVNLDWMIIWACKWFNRKLSLAHGDINRAIDLWNGDSTGKYRVEIYEKMKLI